MTRHIGARPEIVAPAAIDAASAASLLDLDQLHAATAGDEEVRSEASIPPAYRAIRAFIREPAFADAGRIWEVIAPLSPQGASVADLADYLSIDAGRVSAALALLDSYSAVEISDMSEGRAVRAGKGMIA